MCGICGFAGFSDRRLLERMAITLRHRGPDQPGFYDQPGKVGLAIQRLSIIDVAGGKQPVFNEDKTVVTVFNGEIYNYRELRKRLEQAGHRFYTNSDTEVIVHLYEEHGDDFEKHLRGMFAIALWDRIHERLLLVRDRVGIKPLYYSWEGRVLLFGSEIKAILATNLLNRELNPQAVHSYLSLLYIPAPLTIFKKVNSLLPGQLLVVQDKEIRHRQYWQLPMDAPKINSLPECVEALRAKLDETLRIHLVSDVPLGAFLSGGIDSSVVVALMSKYSREPVRTFSIGFSGDGRGFDELEKARRVSRLLKTIHTEERVRFDIVQLLPKIIWQFDQPFGNSTAPLVYLLSRFSRQAVTVALSGTGGDEAFWGYPRYQALGVARNYLKIPGFLRRHAIGPLVSVLLEPTLSNDARGRFTKRLKKLILNSQNDEQAQYISWLTYFSQDELSRLLCAPYQPGMASALESLQGSMAEVSNQAIEDQIFYADISNYLPFNQLEYMDKMSMAASLEARVPFCDHELLELCARIPSQYKLFRNTPKYVFKEACRSLLPNDMIYQGKVGFDAPTGAWFKGPLKPFIESIFLSRALGHTGIFNPRTVREYYQAHLSGKKDYSLHLWMILVFEVWHRLYIENNIDEEPNFGLIDLFS